MKSPRPTRPDPITGKLDPTRFVRESEAARAAIVASGGLINDRSLYQYMQTAGPMARMMSDADTFYSNALTSIMDMGGFRAGTAMTAVGRQLLGGKMTNPTAEEMERMHLLVPGKWHKSGTGVVVDPGGVVGEDILKDPAKGALEWANKILLPSLSGSGIKDVASVQQEMYKIFGTETARRMMGLFVQNESQIDRDIKLYKDAKLEDPYTRMITGDYAENAKNFGAAFSNLAQALGAPEVPKAIAAMRGLSGMMNDLADKAIAHPTASGLAVDATAVASTLAMIGGGLGVAKSWFGIGPGASGYFGAIGKVLGFLNSPVVVAGTTVASLSGDTNPNTLSEVDRQRRAQYENYIQETTKPFGNALWDWLRDNVHVGFPDKYGDIARESLYRSGYGYSGDALKAEMDLMAIRAKAFSGLPPPLPSVIPPDLQKQIQGPAQQGALQGLTTGAAQAQPSIQTAVNSGTSGGVLAGLHAASGPARALIQSWFAGAASGVVNGLSKPTQSVVVHTSLNVSGREVAKVVSTHIASENRMAMNTGSFDGSGWPTPVGV